MKEKLREVSWLFEDERIKSLHPFQKDMRGLINLSTEANIKFSVRGSLYEWAWYPIAYDGSETFYGLISDSEGVRIGEFGKSDLEQIHGIYGSGLKTDFEMEPKTIFDLAIEHTKERTVAAFAQY